MLVGVLGSREEEEEDDEGEGTGRLGGRGMREKQEDAEGETLLTRKDRAVWRDPN